MSHPKFVNKKSDEIEKAEADYHKAVTRADIKYDVDNPSTIQKISNSITQLVSSSYDPNAYANAMGVKNELDYYKRCKLSIIIFIMEILSIFSLTFETSGHD